MILITSSSSLLRFLFVIYIGRRLIGLCFLLICPEYTMFDFDLNERFIEEENNDDEPFLGQTFETQEEAFVFYNKYAKRRGYVVRKDRSDTKHGRTIRRDFYCHRAGKKTLKVVDLCKPQRNKESSRCECKAHMRITLKKSFDIFPEEWHVTKILKQHNHEMYVGA